jgi:hypothetical protein
MACYFTSSSQLGSSALCQQYNPTDQRDGSRDRRHRYGVIFVARRVDRPHVDHLLSSRISETTPSQARQSQHDQHDSQYLVHNCEMRFGKNL